MKTTVIQKICIYSVSKSWRIDSTTEHNADLQADWLIGYLNWLTDWLDT